MRPARETLRSPDDLITAGLAPRDRLGELEQVAARYALALTPDIVDLIDTADPCDPIARQFVPDAAELDPRPRSWPIRSGTICTARSPASCIAIPTACCSSRCMSARSIAGSASVARWSVASRRSRAPSSLRHRLYPRPFRDWEVIFTGGDPLVLSPRRLREIVTALAAIEHVKIVRFHTRVPVVAPRRVTPELVLALRAQGKATYVGAAAQPRARISKAARASCARLIDAGIPVLSQTVLLRGVNDDAETLGELMRALVECRIKPYYLHHGDLAPGTAHWRASIEEGQALMRELRGRLSGLCQPTYVLDIPGGHGKSPIGPGSLSKSAWRRGALWGHGFQRSPARLSASCGGAITTLAAVLFICCSP